MHLAVAGQQCVVPDHQYLLLPVRVRAVQLPAADGARHGLRRSDTDTVPVAGAHHAAAAAVQLPALRGHDDAGARLRRQLLLVVERQLVDPHQ